jgi:hypothetical protein
LGVPEDTNPTPPPLPSSPQQFADTYCTHRAYVHVYIYTQQLTEFFGADESLKSKLDDIFCRHILLFLINHIFSMLERQSLRYSSVQDRIEEFQQLVEKCKRVKGEIKTAKQMNGFLKKQEMLKCRPVTPLDTNISAKMKPIPLIYL